MSCLGDVCCRMPDSSILIYGSCNSVSLLFKGCMFQKQLIIHIWCTYTFGLKFLFDMCHDSMVTKNYTIFKGCSKMDHGEGHWRFSNLLYLLWVVAFSLQICKMKNLYMSGCGLKEVPHSLFSAFNFGTALIRCIWPRFKLQYQGSLITFS